MVKSDSKIINSLRQYKSVTHFVGYVNAKGLSVSARLGEVKLNFVEKELETNKKKAQ